MPKKGKDEKKGIRNGSEERDDVWGGPWKTVKETAQRAFHGEESAWTKLWHQTTKGTLQTSKQRSSAGAQALLGKSNRRQS